MKLQKDSHFQRHAYLGLPPNCRCFLLVRRRGRFSSRSRPFAQPQRGHHLRQRVVAVAAAAALLLLVVVVWRSRRFHQRDVVPEAPDLSGEDLGPLYGVLRMKIFLGLLHPNRNKTETPPSPGHT